MLMGFAIENGRLQQMQDVTVNSACQWFDLVAPDDQERTLVDRKFGDVVPEAGDLEELEASSRYYTDDDGIHINSLFMYRTEGFTQNGTVAFTLSPERLITSRDMELPDFRLLRLRTRNTRVEAASPLAVMLLLFEQKVDHLADELEDLYGELERVSRAVLTEEETNEDLEEDIDDLAEIEDINGKVRLCIMDTQRAITYLMRHIRSDADALETSREILRDAESLLTHTNFVFDKVNFLMDAAQGFISIKQNQIIKIFSIAAVVFLPPTMIASIYGMNYDHMPELSWEYGYPMTIGLMVLSGIAPYVFFKRKGWL